MKKPSARKALRQKGRNISENKHEEAEIEEYAPSKLEDNTVSNQNTEDFVAL